MPTYETGKQTRQAIVQAARIFFWEKGYQKTRYEDFTKQYRINTGLIYYHFKKKELIGREVYQEVASEIRGIIQQMMGAEKSLVSFALLYELMWYFFDKSPQYARFVREAIEVRIHSEEIKQQSLAWMKDFNLQYQFGFSPEELQMQSIAVVGSQVELIYSYLSEELRLDALHCCRYDIQNALHQMKLQTNAIEEAIHQAEQLMTQYSFDINDGFQFSCQKL